MRWVLGLNKYSHDAGCCLLSTDGARSIVVPNERLSRRKHDGGDTAAAVRHALESAGVSLEDVVAVCSNNHHHRVAPFERRLPWSVELGLYPASCLSPHNLLPGVPHTEVSHHLAHAWSVIAQAPFDEGLVVVMDGMGETYDAMAHHHSGEGVADAYAHDLQLEPCGRHGYLQVPRTMQRHVGYREAESVYSFSGSGVRKVFKRWVPMRSPPELYNHGFENLESLGALYSRVSSHLFGDWNACGKVMGLGPWAAHWAPSTRARADVSSLVSGRLEGVDDGDALRLDWASLQGLPHANGFKSTMDAAGDAALDVELQPANVRERRRFYADLAARVQTDLEEVALGFLQRLQQRTGHTNLCVVGGVAQNSVLNGRICREAGFTNVFIPPCPGDEGIPIGCAAYAQHVLLPNLGLQSPPLRRTPWPAYQGREYSAEEVENAIEEFLPWLERVQPAGDGDSVATAVRALVEGEIVAVWAGRAEVGARALGHRSILADPRRADIHRRVNIVKQREQWRPLAPSVLAEHADEWFDGVPSCGSPYMSITASVKPEARTKVPAVTHVDGSARLQTVDAAEAPDYYALILAFFALAGVPMVLNTSFNLNKMPIVEARPTHLNESLDEAQPRECLTSKRVRVFRVPTEPGGRAGVLPRRRRGSLAACARWDAASSAAVPTEAC